MEANEAVRKKIKKTRRNLLIATFTAIAASLCCITPVFAFFAGISGIASTFSWLEPARPYLIGVTILVLGFAWYQKLKPRSEEEIQCECEEDMKPSFWQSKMFLGIITIFTVLLLTFPHYAHIFYPNEPKNVIVVEEANIEEVEFVIEGMFCEACEEHIIHAVNEVLGVVKVSSSYINREVVVKYDKSRTTVDEITEAINNTGYKVIDVK